MSVLNVKLYPDDPLTQVADPIDTIGSDIRRLAKNMFDTMEAEEGVGLAGPQVGVSKRIFVLREPEGEEMCLINPEIVEAEGREEGEEGCLSLPKIYAPVNRATRIRVRAKNLDGEGLDFEATDFLARIIQHELDHLNGVIFLDRVDILTRQMKLAEWDEVRNRVTAQAGRG